MPNEKSKKKVDSHNREHDENPKSETKIKQNQLFTNVKGIVLKHLSKYKKELKDEGIKFEPISLGVNSSDIEPLAALELVKKEEGESEDSPDLHKTREQVVDMVQQLVDGIQSDGERVIVVNVNTPAVDLDKQFNQDQLSFMKKDIFNSIEQQLGVKFHDDVEEQWGSAFSAMMDIVESHKEK